MQRRSLTAHGGLAVVVVALLLQAPSADAQIQKASASPYVAPPDQALVVFSRPRRKQISDVTFRIVNQAGRCLAVLDNGWHTTAPIWPGTHILMVISGTAPPTVQLFQLKVGPGKTYVVQFRERVNVKRPAQIQVLRRSEQPQEAFPPAIRDRLPAKPDLRTCTEWVSWKKSKIQAKAHQAKQDWDESGEKDREAHTVHRSDGWTASEVLGP